MNEKEIMLYAVNSLGYFVLRDFKLETGEISDDSFIDSVKEEIWGFLELLDTTLETYEILPEIREALKYELREGDYDLGSFLIWLAELFGDKPSLVTNFYCDIIDEIHAEETTPKKACSIISQGLTFVLEVDDMRVRFFGCRDEVEYFAEHYRDLGYKIQYFRESPGGELRRISKFRGEVDR